MKFWNFLHATASLLVSFYIGSTAYVMDTSFLLLRGGGELIGSLLSAVFFSCLLVIPFTSLVKLVSDDIRLRTTVYALLAGVLLAPLPLAMQEYMFIRKVSPLIEAETSGSPASWRPGGGHLTDTPFVPEPNGPAVGSSRCWIRPRDSKSAWDDGKKQTKFPSSLELIRNVWYITESREYQKYRKP